MDVEHTIKTISMLPAEDFKTEVDRLQQEGWQLVPGVPPVAIYHLIRDKRMTGANTGARGGITLKDEGVLILKPDGTVQ